MWLLENEKAFGGSLIAALPSTAPWQKLTFSRQTALASAGQDVPLRKDSCRTQVATVFLFSVVKLTVYFQPVNSRSRTTPSRANT
jgi:hypothetical protein